MKKITVYMILFLNSIFFTISQNLYDDFKSQSIEVVEELNSKYKREYSKILKNRFEYYLKENINNIDYDYLFIEEHYSTYSPDGSISRKFYTVERYFNKEDSIPFYMLENANKTDIKEEYYEKYLIYDLENRNHKKLNFLYDSFLKLERIQRFGYEKKQVMFWGRYKNKSNCWYKRQKKKIIKGEYIILTMIDKINNKVIVSIQLPPKRIKIEVRIVSVERIL